ncbi:type 1 fimbrial protein [Pseudomonas sp. PDM05]|jgi:hypothetical protein|uniref:type 1 fimbrial protein n=1 Tax=Pseudomonas sp. PDM05 TaxID=2769301 RepID=UPI00177F8A83|nr:type 1 fimbrial protein [Pseudomonas sp. PDM05]MBD9456099.1 type 1 fimbrial protein [Pseudomonas sp. PDM05]
MNNVMRLSVLTGFLAMWTGVSMAAPSGVIRFSGSVVMPGCESAAVGGRTLELKGCPQASRGSGFDVRSVGSVKALGNAPANVKLVSDSGDGRYYDQRYELVDAAGKPIQSGLYVVTMTAP